MSDEKVKEYAKRIFKETNDEQFIGFFIEMNRLREDEDLSSSPISIDDFDIDEFCRYLKDVLFEIRKERKDLKC